jgi:hypothetical protein
VKSLFVWLISHQPAVLYSQNNPATSNQPPVLFSQNKSAPATSQTNRLYEHVFSKIMLTFHKQKKGQQQQKISKVALKQTGPM